MIRYYGEGQSTPGAPGNIGSQSPRVRFDPTQLNVQPRPGYNMQPGYDPSRVDIERDRFILFNPQSGVAAGPDLPFGGGGAYKTRQEQFRPGSADRQRIPDPIRVFPQSEPGREGAIDVRFRQAMQAYPGIGNVGGLIDNSQFYMGPQLGQMPTGFQNKFVS